MTVYKCKICGGNLIAAPGETAGVCDSCGTRQALPTFSDTQKTNLFERADYLLLHGEFDRAAELYENILALDSKDAQAYWSLVLCKYGVEYIENPKTGKRTLTCNRTQFTPVFSDSDYQAAIEYAFYDKKTHFESEARKIDAIQKQILSISQKEDPFDVFICYKENDEKGGRTPDSVLAEELYNELTQEGFKVFFARITLEKIIGAAYEPYIFAALNSAKVMVVVGTRPEHFNAVWVKNEWMRYLNLIRNGAKKTIIPAYKDMSAGDLPAELSRLQAQDMSKLGFMLDLIRGIKKYCAADRNFPTKEACADAENAQIPNTDNWMALAEKAYVSEEWDRALIYIKNIFEEDSDDIETLDLTAKILAGKFAAGKDISLPDISLYTETKQKLSALAEKDKRADITGNLHGYAQRAEDFLQARLTYYEKIWNDTVRQNVPARDLVNARTMSGSLSSLLPLVDTYPELEKINMLTGAMEQALGRYQQLKTTATAKMTDDYDAGIRQIAALKKYIGENHERLEAPYRTQQRMDAEKRAEQEKAEEEKHRMLRETTENFWAAHAAQKEAVCAERDRLEALTANAYEAEKTLIKARLARIDEMLSPERGNKEISEEEAAIVNDAAWEANRKELHARLQNEADRNALSEKTADYESHKKRRKNTLIFALVCLLLAIMLSFAVIRQNTALPYYSTNMPSDTVCTLAIHYLYINGVYSPTLKYRLCIEKNGETFLLAMDDAYFELLNVNWDTDQTYVSPLEIKAVTGRDPSVIQYINENGIYNMILPEDMVIFYVINPGQMAGNSGSLLVAAVIFAVFMLIFFIAYLILTRKVKCLKRTIEQSRALLENEENNAAAPDTENERVK